MNQTPYRDVWVGALAGSLCCVLGQDTLLSQCLSPPRSINGYQILLLTFKCLDGQAPDYLIKLITARSQLIYSLRSSEGLLLVPPSNKYRSTLGDHAFQSAAPMNKLPAVIRNIETLDVFKTAIKTHFFNLAFK